MSPQVTFGRPRRDEIGNRTPIRVAGDEVGEIIGSGPPYGCLYVANIEGAELGWTVPTLNKAKDRVRAHFARIDSGQGVLR